MVQNASMSQSQFGTIARVGMTQDGRAVYQVVSADGKSGMNVSIPNHDCDRFERAYNDLTEAAPKLQAYMETHSTPEAAKKVRRRTAWTIGGVTGAAFIGTSLLTRKWKPVWKWLTTIAGGIAGFVGGAVVAAKMSTPPGAKSLKMLQKFFQALMYSRYNSYFTDKDICDKILL